MPTNEPSRFPDLRSDWFPLSLIIARSIQNNNLDNCLVIHITIRNDRNSVPISKTNRIFITLSLGCINPSQKLLPKDTVRSLCHRVDDLVTLLPL